MGENVAETLSYFTGKLLGLWVVVGLIAFVLNVLADGVAVARGYVTPGQAVGWGLRFWVVAVVIALVAAEVGVFLLYGRSLVSRLVLRPLGRVIAAADAVADGKRRSRLAAIQPASSWSIDFNCSRSSGEFGCPWEETACCTAASRTSSSVPEIFKVQFFSLG